MLGRTLAQQFRTAFPNSDSRGLRAMLLEAAATPKRKTRAEARVFEEEGI
jgi:hypothetical protein